METVTELRCRVVRPHPPITRGLQYVKEKLVAAGIKVVDWEPFNHDHGWEIIVSIFRTHLQPNLLTYII
jgi:hypothetical protein